MADSKIKASIIGATGYTGQELIRLLAQHPNVSITAVTSKTYAGQAIDSVFPSLAKSTRLVCEEENIDRLAERSDVIFMALPHAIAAQRLSKDHLSKAKVIDLGADFRLDDPDVYKQWYELEHPNPSLIADAVYGLSEWNREEIKQSSLIANPGCYATCSLLALLPAVVEGILEEDSIVVDAKSGVSGAGRSLSLDVHFNECNENIKAYKLARHRHTPEIEQELAAWSQKEIKITFTPHLVPMQRGILVTAYGSLKEELSAQDLYDSYHSTYENEPFIRLARPGVDNYPETRWTRGSNYCDIGFAVDARAHRAIIVAALDNLVKGAAGQAIQNMNIIFGLDETAGLGQIPLFP